MINYTHCDLKSGLVIKVKTDAKTFVREFNFNKDMLKELFKFGEIIVDDIKILINSNNYKYKRLIEREL